MRIPRKEAISLALDAVNAEISGNASRGGRYAGAVASEGYAGGYADALNDVLLLLNGVVPNRRNYWDLVARMEKAVDKCLTK